MRPAAPVVDTRLTDDDFLLFPDDGKRHELIDGVHYVTPSPRLRHQFLSPLDVVLSHYDVVGVRRRQVLRPTAEGRLARVEALSAEDGGTLTTPLLPGCGIDVRTPFRPTL